MLIACICQGIGGNTTIKHKCIFLSFISLSLLLSSLSLCYCDAEINTGMESLSQSSNNATVSRFSLVAVAARKLRKKRENTRVRNLNNICCKTKIALEKLFDFVCLSVNSGALNNFVERNVLAISQIGGIVVCIFHFHRPNNNRTMASDFTNKTHTLCRIEMQSEVYIKK